MGKFMDTYENMKQAGLLGGVGEADTRYKVPKESPKVSDELVEETIESTEIYRRAKALILKAQHKQVAYGIDKYPEPLNADTWSMIETIDHIIDESVDKLHYLVMLRVKLEREAEKEMEKARRDSMDAMAYAISSGADMDGDLLRYCKADVEATLNFHETISAMSSNNNIQIGDETIEALDNGKVAINGVIINSKELSSIQLMEESLNLLTRAVIALAGGNPSVRTNNN